MIQKPILNGNYTCIQNEVLRDRDLKELEMAVYCVLCSMHPDWVYSARDLANYMGRGVNAIKRAVARLREKGYIKVKQEHFHGRFGENVVEIVDLQRRTDGEPAEKNRRTIEGRTDGCATKNIKYNNKNNIYTQSVQSKSFTELSSPDQQEDRQTDEPTPEDPELRDEIELAVHRDQLVEEYEPGAVELAIDVIEDVLTAPDSQKVKVAGREIPAKKIKAKFREMTYSRAKHALNGWNYGSAHTDIRNSRAYMLRLLVEAADWSPGSGSAAAAPTVPESALAHRARRPRQQQNSFHFSLERRRTAEEWADIERQLCDITMRGYSAYASLTNSPQAQPAGDPARQMV